MTYDVIEIMLLVYVRQRERERVLRVWSYTVVKVDGATPKRWLNKGHDKPIHGSGAIYFPGGLRV